MAHGPPSRTEAEFWAHLLPPNAHGCRLWPKIGSNGDYGKTSWQGEHMLAHQAAFFIANGWRPKGRYIVIRHTCDERRCCEPAHLIIGTQKDNARDRDERNRHNRPPSWKRGKLTPDQVREIRTRHAAGESYPRTSPDRRRHRRRARLMPEDRIYCAGAGVIDPDAGTYTMCGNPATNFRYMVAAGRGWAATVPLCNPHAALWDTDIGAAYLAVQLAKEHTR
jgi:hypothetical protein